MAKRITKAQKEKVANNVMALDTFSNMMARTGFGTPSLMEATTYPLTRYTKDYLLMNSLYRNSWLARRIVDLPARDMLKNWVSFKNSFTPEQLQRFEKLERLTRIRRDLFSALSWGRLYGGAGCIMMIDGQEDQLEEPLDLDSIMPGDFKGLIPCDRWSGLYPLMGLVEDINSNEYGLPEFYEFRNLTTTDSLRVHHTRILRFTGLPLPPWELQAEQYWGSSVIENVYEELKKRDNTSYNIAGLIFLANLRVIKMSDLGQLLGGTDADVQKNVYGTMSRQNWLQSNFGMYVMDKDDDFQTFTASFDGIHQVYELFMLDLSGAAQIPVTKLFGRSPAGMNATGESDLQNYYDFICQEQEAVLRPPLEKLFPVMCMSEFGMIPDELDFEFKPVEEPSDEDRGNTIKWKTEAILGYHDRGIISDQTALEEAKLFGEDAGIFTSISDDDINKASDETGPPDLGEMPGSEEDEQDPEALEKIS